MRLTAPRGNSTMGASGPSPPGGGPGQIGISSPSTCSIGTPGCGKGCCRNRACQKLSTPQHGCISPLKRETDFATLPIPQPVAHPGYRAHRPPRHSLHIEIGKGNDTLTGKVRVHDNQPLLFEISEQPSRAACGMGTVSARNPRIEGQGSAVSAALARSRKSPCKSSETRAESSSAVCQPGVAAVSSSTPRPRNRNAAPNSRSWTSGGQVACACAPGPGIPDRAPQSVR